MGITVRFIKLVLISLIVLFILATALTALLPSVVLVSRAINIQAPADSILVRIKDINQWKGWMEGMNDPSVKIMSATTASFGGTEISITAVSDTAVTSNWITGKTGPQVSTIRLITQPGQQVTIVQWQFVQHLKWYPWEKIGSIMNDKIMGPMMEKNLANLKKSL